MHATIVRERNNLVGSRGMKESLDLQNVSEIAPSVIQSEAKDPVSRRTYGLPGTKWILRFALDN